MWSQMGADTHHPATSARGGLKSRRAAPLLQPDGLNAEIKRRPSALLQHKPLNQPFAHMLNIKSPGRAQSKGAPSHGYVHNWKRLKSKLLFCQGKVLQGGVSAVFNSGASPSLTGLRCGSIVDAMRATLFSLFQSVNSM